jgi:hypothetical protein
VPQARPPGFRPPAGRDAGTGAGGVLVGRLFVTAVLLLFLLVLAGLLVVVGGLAIGARAERHGRGRAVLRRLHGDPEHLQRTVERCVHIELAGTTHGVLNLTYVCTIQAEIRRRARCFRGAWRGVSRDTEETSMDRPVKPAPRLAPLVPAPALKDDKNHVRAAGTP